MKPSNVRILGQGTENLVGRGPAAREAVRTDGVLGITEATALSLMGEMMLK